MESKFKIFVFSFLFLIRLSFGQGAVGIDNSANQLINSINQMSNGGQQIVSSYIKNPPRNIRGSYYIFEDWTNQGLIQVTNDKTYRLANVNVNVKDDRFEAKFGKDSIFSFDAQAIDFFSINDRKFKKIHLGTIGRKKICEIIIEDETFSIIKVYRSEIKKNDPDPLMLKPDGDEFVLNFQYHLKKGEVLEKFKLNKKQVLGLFPKKAKLIDTYVKEHKLSYKKSEHLKKIYAKWKTLQL